MSSYQQMGHHSENLLFEPELGTYSGAILSPVNYDPAETTAQITRIRDGLRSDFDLIFDPQLYYPHTERGVLDRWPYFPADFDSADPSSSSWWESILEFLSDTVIPLGVDAVCSPAVVPRTFGTAYYTQLSAITNSLRSRLSNSGVRLLQTTLVDLPSLSEAGHAEVIASIVSQGQTDEVFLVALGGGEPRREMTDAEPLKGFMRLIAAMEGTGIRVLVGFSAADIVLWKAAGASACATGKFFNLRRFTASRFDEPSGGGGQLPYWFEESLLAFLRESDLIRVKDEGMLSQTSLQNPGQRILQHLEDSPGVAWVALAWRQWMHWFADIEARMEDSTFDVSSLLADAERNWLTLDDRDVLMEEPRNDGSWLRPWRRALSEYNR